MHRSISVGQPTQCLLDEWDSAGPRRCQLTCGGEAVGGQVGHSGGDADGNGGSAAFLAGNRHAASVQLVKLLYQGKADAGALMSARARMSDTVKPLEHPAQIRLGNSDAGIRDAQFDAIIARLHLDAYFTFEGELERIRQE